MVAVGLGMVVLAVFGAIAGPAHPEPTPRRCSTGTAAGSATAPGHGEPLVDIRKRLVDQSDVEAFTVRPTSVRTGDSPRFDKFDGTVWSSSGSFAEADGDLPGDAEGAVKPIVQDYVISGLQGDLAPRRLPAARREDQRRRRPLRHRVVHPHRRQQPGHVRRRELPGDVRTPQLDVDLLDQNEGTNLPGPIRSRYLPLPSDFPDSVSNLAESIMLGGQNTYQRARLLQDWFRNQFTYDLSGVRAGAQRGRHRDLPRVEARLLRAVRRDVRGDGPVTGIPARVAVGFTPGRVDEDSDGTRSHRARSQRMPGPRCGSTRPGGCLRADARAGCLGAEEWTGVTEQ